MYINKKHIAFFTIFYTVYVLMLITIIPQKATIQNGTKPFVQYVPKEPKCIIVNHTEPQLTQESMKQKIQILEKELIAINKKLAVITKTLEVKNLEVVEKIPEFSQKDIDLLARVTMSESSIEPYETKVAVAQTVINRLHSGRFGNTISEIVYTKNQFSTADNGDPTDEVYKAVQEAIDNPPHPTNMFYFRDWYYHAWAVDYKQFGGMYFSLDK